jgi:hypothetical protein
MLIEEEEIAAENSRWLRTGMKPGRFEGVG